jgi:hypothetical protein
MGSHWVWWFWGWEHEREVTRQCRSRTDVLDALPAVVRNAIHEAAAYTEPEWARSLVRRHGATRAAEMILARKEDDKT